MSEVKEQRELRLQQILDMLQRFKRQWQFLPESQEVVDAIDAAERELVAGQLDENSHLAQLARAMVDWARAHPDFEQ
jgi:hypothetical protein